jgi:hypothetical protein
MVAVWHRSEEASYRENMRDSLGNHLDESRTKQLVGCFIRILSEQLYPKLGPKVSNKSLGII